MQKVSEEKCIGNAKGFLEGWGNTQKCIGKMHKMPKNNEKNIGKMQKASEDYLGFLRITLGFSKVLGF